MYEPSQRAKRLPVSPIRRLVPLAEAAKRAGKTVYHLNIGQPDIATLEAFREGVIHAPPIVAYSPSQGLAHARRALCGYYARCGIALSPEQIVLTTGGSEGLVFSLMTLCDPGDEFLVPEPFYANYKSYATITDVTLCPIPTRADDGFRLPPKQAIENLVTSRTKAILFCSPGNPTGTVYTRAELERLRDVALGHGLFLVSDEVYREFVYNDQGHVSLFHLEGIDECGVLVDSISKRYSACGARLGCVASRNPTVVEAVTRYGQARLSPPALSEHGLIGLLAHPDTEAQVQALVARFRARRDAFCQGIQRVPGVFCRAPEGALYAIVTLPVDDGERFCAWLLRDFDLDGQTVQLAPAADFYATPGMGANQVRVAFVLNRQTLRRCVTILQAALAAYPGARQPAPSSR